MAPEEASEARLARRAATRSRGGPVRPAGSAPPTLSCITAPRPNRARTRRRDPALPWGMTDRTRSDAIGGSALPSRPGARLVSLGEFLIDFVPADRGVTLEDAERFVRAAGGAPANVAVGASRLGVPAAFLGKVGDDPFGRHLAQVLEREGVDASGVRFDQEARTALAFVSLGEGGERDFVFYRNPSADMRYRPD